MKQRYFYVSIVCILVLLTGLNIYLISSNKEETTVQNNPQTEIVENSETTPIEIASSTATTTTTDTLEPVPTSTTTPPTETQTTSNVPIIDSPKPMPETPKPNNLTTMAWMYPSEPGCNAQKEYHDGRQIDILKPEFFTVNGGSLFLYDAENSSCNGFSPAFVADLKKYSKQQFVTISSASADDMNTFFESALGEGDDIDVLVKFITTNNLTGIELDFEDFGGWSKDSYANFLLFVDRLGTKLHANGKKLMLDGPSIADANEQTWFNWRYEDFVDLPVDYIVIMAYDYQFDHGIGEPIAPLDWMNSVIKWASNRYPKERLSVGVPSYGYEGVIGKRPYIRTYDQLKNKPGFASAERDSSSGELTWQSGKNVYFYQDTESIRQKIAQVKKSGLNSISIWHLGGNQWY